MERLVLFDGPPRMLRHQCSAGCLPCLCSRSPQLPVSYVPPETLQALALEPNNATAFHNRGSLYERVGRLQDALSDFTKAIEIEP